MFITNHYNNLNNLFEDIQKWMINSHKWTAFLVYLAFLFDNILLSMVVPIIPIYLNILENSEQKLFIPIYSEISIGNVTQSNIYKSKTGFSTKFMREDSDVSTIGSLLSSKAFIQLMCNPLISILVNRLGYSAPLLFGSFIILLSSLIYGIGNSFWHFLLSRSIHGLGSACITVSGMSTIAELYREEGERSKVMGYILGGTALGVLIGYPFGGFAYNFLGKSTSFIIVSINVSALIVCQLITYRGTFGQRGHYENISIGHLLTDTKIIVAIGAIATSTTSMSILESGLPIWLMEHLDPPKWTLGTVFIPDSIGYLIGTSLFGGIAYKYGRWLTALISLVLIGVCTFAISFANTIVQLIVPHFGLGLGIGVTDAAMVPLLANIIDTRHNLILYGSVYALSQMAVCLSYSFGPLIGGHLEEHFGFPSLMRIVGLMNIIYCPLCLTLRSVSIEKEEKKQKNGEETVWTFN